MCIRDSFVRHQASSFGIDAKRPDGDGIVTGYGTIDGRQVCVYSQDFTVFGGSLGEAHGRKIQKIQDLALRTGVPEERTVIAQNGVVVDLVDGRVPTDTAVWAELA